MTKETKCAICWWEKNPPGEYDGVEVKAEFVLKQFNVCKKHKGVLMSSCKKCESQSTTFKEGISKKSGKPWKAYKCDDCGEMNWVFTKTPTAPQTRTSPVAPNSTIEKKLDLILAILKQNFPPLAEVAEEQETNEVPF